MSSSEDNVFKVQFPSKLELQRMIRFGKFNVPTSECRITFDEWSPKVNPNWLLQDVWVRIAGIPPAVKEDFLALWGLGSLLGKTKEVDMAYTRQHGVLRIFIGCVDYTCILERKDVFIKDGLYRLTFQVEGPPREEEHADEIMHDANEGDDEGDKKKDASEKFDLEDRSGKRTKNVDGGTSTSSSVGGSGGAAAPTSAAPTDEADMVMIHIGSTETPVLAASARCGAARVELGSVVVVEVRTGHALEATMIHSEGERLASLPSSQLVVGGSRLCPSPSSLLAASPTRMLGGRRSPLQPVCREGMRWR